MSARKKGGAKRPEQLSPADKRARQCIEYVCPALLAQKLPNPQLNSPSPVLTFTSLFVALSPAAGTGGRAHARTTLTSLRHPRPPPPPPPSGAAAGVAAAACPAPLRITAVAG